MDFKNNYDFLTLFEKRLSEFTGAPYVVLTDCCTNAIFLAFKHFGNQYSEIDIPAQTYISVPQILDLVGYIPIFKHIEWKESYEIGESNIFDYAVGFKENMYVPGQVQCISFQQKKALPIGRGGAILLDNEEDYKALKQLGYDGRYDPSVHISKDPELSRVGFHMYMTPDNAAKGVILLNQLTPKDIDSHLGAFYNYPRLDR